MQEALYALTYVGDAKEIYSDTIESLRARLAQPEPLPEKSKGALSHEENKRHNKKILDKFYEENAHLYTAPPQREWQGLTEGETIDLALSAFALPEVSSETREKIHRDLVIAMNDQDSRLMLFAANIEAKLKEKNT
jgi:hypothetical protein